MTSWSVADKSVFNTGFTEITVRVKLFGPERLR